MTPRKLLRPRNLWLAAAAVVLLLILAQCVFAKKPGPRYLTAPVVVSDIEQSVLATGTLQPYQLVDVGAQATGQVRSLKVALNDHVTKGQLLAVIDPSTQINNLRNAEAVLAQERAQRLAQAATVRQNDLVLARQKITLAADASSRADYEAAEAAVQVGQGSLAALDAQIRQAAVAVDKAKVDLGYTNIVAPMDGVVVGVVAKEGQTLNAVQSAPTVVKLARLDLMTVKAQISEADVIKVHPGQTVYFTILGDPERRFYARLRSVEPAPESITSQATAATATTASATNTAVYYDGLFDIPNPTGLLRTSMTAQVYIVLAEARRVASIPSAALGARGPDGRYPVQVMDARGKTADRRVKIGVNNNISAQVLDGLKVGEKVVVGEGPAKAASDGKFGPPGSNRRHSAAVRVSN
jgi:macrolide-specific efflux system membrane fusion protein